MEDRETSAKEEVTKKLETFELSLEMRRRILNNLCLFFQISLAFSWLTWSILFAVLTTTVPPAQSCMSLPWILTDQPEIVQQSTPWPLQPRCNTLHWATRTHPQPVSPFCFDIDLQTYSCDFCRFWTFVSCPPTQVSSSFLLIRLVFSNSICRHVFH